MDSLIETIKGLNKLTFDSTINVYEHYNSEEDVKENNPKSDPWVSTHTSDGNERRITDTDTTEGNYSHKLLTNIEIPVIIQGVTPSANQTPADGVATSERALHEVRAVLHKEIVTGTMCSSGIVLKDPPVVNWKYIGGTIQLI